MNELPMEPKKVEIDASVCCERAGCTKLGLGCSTFGYVWIGCREHARELDAESWRREGAQRLAVQMFMIDAHSRVIGVQLDRGSDPPLMWQAQSTITRLVDMEYELRDRVRAWLERTT